MNSPHAAAPGSIRVGIVAIAHHGNGHAIEQGYAASGLVVFERTE